MEVENKGEEKPFEYSFQSFESKAIKNSPKCVDYCSGGLFILIGTNQGAWRKLNMMIINFKHNDNILYWREYFYTNNK